MAAIIPLNDVRAPAASAARDAFVRDAALAPAGQKSPMSWPIVTALPYIAQPTKHVFLKPASMRSAATGLGVDLKFKSTPNSATYERTLAFGKNLLEFIEPRSGADMIDVQAFIAAMVE